MIQLTPEDFHWTKCRGSLYRLLHKPGATEMLDERRRISMAYDVVNFQKLNIIIFYSVYFLS